MEADPPPFIMHKTFADETYKSSLRDRSPSWTSLQRGRNHSLQGLSKKPLSFDLPFLGSKPFPCFVGPRRRPRSTPPELFFSLPSAAGGFTRNNQILLPFISRTATSHKVPPLPLSSNQPSPQALPFVAHRRRVADPFPRQSYYKLLPRTAGVKL